MLFWMPCSKALDSLSLYDAIKYNVRRGLDEENLTATGSYHSHIERIFGKNKCGP
jgi:hypothetical protein